MIPVIDFSFFSLDEFQRKLREGGHKTSSLLLYTADHQDWDILFEESPNLWTYIHEQSGRFHDTYIPNIPAEQFIDRFSYHLKNILKPAETRIKTMLKQLGVEDVEEYMEDSIEWISLLFVKKEQQYYASQSLIDYLGYENGIPLLVVWTDYQSRELIAINLPEHHPNLETYYKTMIWALKNATSTLLNRTGMISIDHLSNEIHHYLNRSVFFRKQTNLIPNLDIIQIGKPIGMMLKDIGTSYSAQFEDAIIHYEKYVRENKIRFLTRHTEELRAEVKKMLVQYGFYFVRQGGNHEIWQHPKLKKVTPVPRHNKLTPDTIRSIKKDILLAESV